MGLDITIYKKDRGRIRHLDSQITMLEKKMLREHLRLNNEAMNKMINFNASWEEIKTEFFHKEGEIEDYINRHYSRKYRHMEDEKHKKYLEYKSLLLHPEQIGYFRHHVVLDSIVCYDIIREKRGYENSEWVNHEEIILTKEECEYILNKSQQELTNTLLEENYSQNIIDEWNDTISLFSSIVKDTNFDKYDIIYRKDV